MKKIFQGTVTLLVGLLSLGGSLAGGSLAGVTLLCGCGGGATTPRPVVCDSGRGGTSTVGDFTRIAIDEAASGAAFVAAADLNGDGKLDLIVSRFGDVGLDGAVAHLQPARIDVYLQGATLGCWQQQPILGPEAKLYFINDVTPADIDGDGDLDLIVPSGFFVCGFDSAVTNCGGLAWLENDHGSWRRHDLIGPATERFYHHAEWVDFDGDGVRDLVTTGETSSSADTIWLKGDTTAERFSHAPTDIGMGGGSWPQVIDVDGDGDLDVASAEYFVSGSSFAWFERGGSGGFVRHVLDASSGKGFELRLVANAFGDGVTRALGTNHTNINDGAGAIASALFAFDKPADPTTSWSKRALSDGIVSRPTVGAGFQGAPGVFGWGDIDGDGDLDLALAGDGDSHTFWLEQTSAGQFTTHTIEDNLGQASGARVVDLDGDGHNELIFTGYEAGAVYVYRRPK